MNKEEVCLRLGDVILNKDDDFFEYWDIERKKGKLKYVLNENKVSLFVVIPFVLILIFLTGYFIRIYTGYTIVNTQVVIKSLLIGSPTVIVPIRTSLKKWKENERRYFEFK
jgi:hypothetical protein